MLPATPSISGRRITTLVGSGVTQQQLVVDSLLPAQVQIAVDGQIPDEAGYNETAEYERMTRRLKIDATGGPARTRFLHVLQGLDGGAAAPVPALVQTTAGTLMQGVEIGTTVVMMPVEARPAFQRRRSASRPAYRDVRTGLGPGGRYTVTSSPSAAAALSC